MILHPAILLNSFIVFQFCAYIPRRFLYVWSSLQSEISGLYMLSIVFWPSGFLLRTLVNLIQHPLDVMTLPLDALKTFSVVWLKCLMGVPQVFPSHSSLSSVDSQIHNLCSTVGNAGHNMFQQFLCSFSSWCSHRQILVL